MECTSWTNKSRETKTRERSTLRSFDAVDDLEILCERCRCKGGIAALCDHCQAHLAIKRKLVCFDDKSSGRYQAWTKPKGIPFKPVKRSTTTIDKIFISSESHVKVDEYPPKIKVTAPEPSEKSIPYDKFMLQHTDLPREKQRGILQKSTLIRLDDSRKVVKFPSEDSIITPFVTSFAHSEEKKRFQYVFPKDKLVEELFTPVSSSELIAGIIEKGKKKYEEEYKTEIEEDYLPRTYDKGERDYPAWTETRAERKYYPSESQMREEGDYRSKSHLRGEKEYRSEKQARLDSGSPSRTKTEKKYTSEAQLKERKHPSKFHDIEEKDYFPEKQARRERDRPTEAQIKGEKVQKAKRERGQPSEAQIEGEKVQRAKKGEGQLSEAQIKGEKVQRAKREKGQLSEAEIKGEKKQRAKIEKGQLSEAQIKGEKVKQAKGEKGQLSETEIKGEKGQRAKLEKGQPEAKIKGEKVKQAKGEKGQLSEAEVKGEKVKQAKGEKGQLSEAEIKGEKGQRAKIDKGQPESQIKGDKVKQAKGEKSQLSETEVKGERVKQTKGEKGQLSEAKIKEEKGQRAKIEKGKQSEAQIKGDKVKQAKGEKGQGEKVPGAPSKEEKGPSKEKKGPSEEEKGPSKEKKGPSKEDKGPSKGEKGPSKEEKGRSKEEKGPSKEEKGQTSKVDAEKTKSQTSKPLSAEERGQPHHKREIPHSPGASPRSAGQNRETQTEKEKVRPPGLQAKGERGQSPGTFGAQAKEERGEEHKSRPGSETRGVTEIPHGPQARKDGGRTPAISPAANIRTDAREKGIRDDKTKIRETDGVQGDKALKDKEKKPMPVEILDSGPKMVAGAVTMKPPGPESQIKPQSKISEKVGNIEAKRPQVQMNDMPIDKLREIIMGPVFHETISETKLFTVFARNLIKLLKISDEEIPEYLFRAPQKYLDEKTYKKIIQRKKIGSAQEFIKRHEILENVTENREVEISEPRANLFQVTHRFEEVEVEDLEEEEEEERDTKGIQYALSDRSYIHNGWTQLPAEKVVRKLFVYRSRPAQPEFDWFNNNKSKRVIFYDTGEKLAELDDSGCGKWYYKTGKIALDYHQSDNVTAQKRFVVYSDKESTGCVNEHSHTPLAMFDLSGNGIVFDRNGRIRLNYNQTEGMVYDQTIGPYSHWKWHSLNDPPQFQTVMVDTFSKEKDPNIVRLGKSNEALKRADEDMLAIELDNFAKEVKKRQSQTFCPFQIRIKTLKINSKFSLRIIDQTRIYLQFRDGQNNLKLNLGILLDPEEVVDTEIAEIGSIPNLLMSRPTTESMALLNQNYHESKKNSRRCTLHENKVQNPMGISSADQMLSGITRPLRSALDQPCLLVSYDYDYTLPA